MSPVAAAIQRVLLHGLLASRNAEALVRSGALSWTLHERSIYGSPQSFVEWHGGLCFLFVYAVEGRKWRLTETDGRIQRRRSEKRESVTAGLYSPGTAKAFISWAAKKLSRLEKGRPDDESGREAAFRLIEQGRPREAPTKQEVAERLRRGAGSLRTFVPAWKIRNR
jgi:hypothetical protein